jgi:hypothetical protein
MVEQNVNDILQEFSEVSARTYGSYAHCAGFFQSMLSQVISGRTSPEDALTYIKQWTEITENQNK